MRPLADFFRKIAETWTMPEGMIFSQTKERNNTSQIRRKYWHAALVFFFELRALEQEYVCDLVPGFELLTKKTLLFSS